MTYLVGLQLAGKRVLVAGVGRVGSRRAVAMAREGAKVVVVAPTADGAIQAAASRDGRKRQAYRASTRPARRAALHGWPHNPAMVIWRSA